jgi:hypothetical protein
VAVLVCQWEQPTVVQLVTLSVTASALQSVYRLARSKAIESAAVSVHS